MSSDVAVAASPSDNPKSSKDLIEHLRTIHFSLITVSIGLVIVVFSSNGYNVRAASEDMARILSAKKVGSPEWIRKQRQEWPKFEPEPINEVGLTHLPLSPDESIQTRDDEDRLTQLLGTVHMKEKTSRLIFVLPEDDWFQMKYVGEPTGSVDFPQNIAEFADLWNGLEDAKGHYLTVYFASTILLEGTLNNLPEKDNYVILSRQFDPLPNIEQVKLTKSNAGTFHFVGYLPGSSQEVSIFPSYFRTIGVTQSLLKGFFPNTRPGSFDTSFPDLDRATKGFESLPLDDAAKRLFDEAAKGGERFEALGMKIPVDQIAVWGTLLVLSLQVYMLANLRRLTSQLVADSSDWTLSWLGLNQSKLAQAILWCTFLLAPVVAIISLGTMKLNKTSWVRILPSGPNIDLAQQVGAIVNSDLMIPMIYCLVTVLCGLGLGLLCWKSRPIAQK